MFVVRETTSELESRDLEDLVICQCRKQQQLVRLVGGFVACFPLNVLMVLSSTLTVTTDSEWLTCGGFSLGKTVRFRSLEFIADCSGSLSLSPKGTDSGTIFMGIAHSGSPSLRSILEDSTEVFYTTSSREGSSSFPISWRRSMGTLYMYPLLTGSLGCTAS
jgi:hypothetical protein